MSRAASLTIFALACSAVCAQEARLGRSYTLAHPPSSEAPSAVLRSLTEVPRGGGVVAGGNVLLFDEESGRPTHLINGVQPFSHPYTFTLVQEVGA